MSKKNKQRRQHHQPSGQRSRAGRNQDAKREVMLEIPAATGITIDRENLHPSLRHLADDDKLGIIIATGGNPDPPEGAGALIGELKADLRASDGTILPEGS